MKWASKCLVLVVALSSIVSGRLSSAGGALDQRQLVEGVLARSNAIVSGELRYRLLVGNPKRPDDVSSELFLIIFSGDSWRASRQGDGTSQFHDEMASHEGAFIDYESTPQKDRSVFHRASIFPPRDTTAIGVNEGAPVFAGTFWYSQSATFVKDHVEQSQRRDPVVINGVSLEILEWSIPRDRALGALGVAPTWMLAAGDAILRISIAPSRGYSLPVIEYLTFDRRVAVRYSSSEFVETAPGIFFPMRCEEQSFDANGQPDQYHKYVFEKVERINEPIPDKDFMVMVPGSTYVVDKRDPLQPISFRAHQAAAAGAPDVSEVVQFGTERPASVPGWRRWQTLPMAILLGVNVGVVGLLGYYIWRRRRARSAS